MKYKKPNQMSAGKEDEKKAESYAHRGLSACAVCKITVLHEGLSHLTVTVSSFAGQTVASLKSER